MKNGARASAPAHANEPSPKHRTSAMGVDGGAPRLRHRRSICWQLRSFHTRPGHQSALGSSASNVWVIILSSLSLLSTTLAFALALALVVF